MLKPIFVLVSPQMGENIGAVARIMANFGIEDLRIVCPRDGWPNPNAITTARNAKHILENAVIFQQTAEAISDCNIVYATTVRPRDMVKPTLTPRLACEEICTKYNNQKIAFLFGPENSGLNNNDIILSNSIVTIPVDIGYKSLNLAQSAAIIAYEYCINKINNNDIINTNFPQINAQNSDVFATKGEINNLVNHLNNLLDHKGYFSNQEMKPLTIKMLSNIFTKNNLTTQEVQSLRGVLTFLEKN